MTSFNMYPATGGDRQELMRLDLRCYDYPLSFEEWGEILSSGKDKKISGEFSGFRCETFKRNNTILGYVVFHDEPNEDNDLEVLKLGVLPAVRQQGVGKMLSDYRREKARTKGFSEAVYTIPEYWLDPNENRGVVNFISSSGLVLHKTLKEAFYHYGNIYDGIVFRTGGTPVPVC
jgi:GNAT superfamily N-acetyltransferase